MKRYVLSFAIVSTVGVALADSPGAESCDGLKGRSLGLCNAFHASECANDAESLSCNTIRDVWEESGNDDPIPGDQTTAQHDCWCDYDMDAYYAPYGTYPSAPLCEADDVNEGRCILVDPGTTIVGSGHDYCDADPLTIADC